jgi:hypothetical protein
MAQKKSTKGPAHKAKAPPKKSAAKKKQPEKAEPQKAAKAKAPAKKASEAKQERPAKPEPVTAAKAPKAAKAPEPEARAPKQPPKAAPAEAEPKDPFSEPPPASDAGRTVDEYVGRLTGWHAMVAKMLRRSIKKVAPDSTEVIKWGQPVYEENGPFAYFRVAQKQIELGFWNGVDLFDEHKVLEGEGERMRHVTIRRPEDMRPQYLEALIRQAAALNKKPEETPA